MNNTSSSGSAGIVTAAFGLIALAWLFTASPSVLADEAARKPNILLLFGDDLGKYASIYAESDRPSPNDIVRTPVFDRIAAEGALFHNAFVSAPSCTPSRAALYTGRHFFRNGSHSQLHHPWQRGVSDPFDLVKGMPNLLADAGYHIGWSHKWHMRESLIGGKGNQYNAHGGRINRFSAVLTNAENRNRAKRRILNEVRGNFRDFLEARPEGKPFFYSFNPTNTHRPWVKGSGKELWGLDPDKLAGRLPSFLPDVPEIREDFADYLGEVMAFDAACGEIIAELEERGELDNTLVCISGDHGIPGFPRGKCNVYDFGSQVLLAMRWPARIEQGRNIEAPVSLIDLAPTFHAAAGTEPEAGTNGQNLLPALVSGGTDQLLRGWALIGRETHVPISREGGVPYPVRAIRTADLLYVVNFQPDRWPMADPPLAKRIDEARNKPEGGGRWVADIDYGPTLDWFLAREGDSSLAEAWQLGFGQRPAEELYDVKSDPDQVHNLAEDPAWQSKREELRKRLFAELEENHDPRLDDAFDRLPYNLRTDYKIAP
jgi:N-sulfoglucosamine sulfohydrolase